MIGKPVVYYGQLILAFAATYLNDSRELCRMCGGFTLHRQWQHSFTAQRRLQRLGVLSKHTAGRATRRAAEGVLRGTARGTVLFM